MAKFLKSLFNPGEKRRGSREGRLEEDDRNDFTPPLDGRRKLSISRSGRMKQNNKRRLSLTNDLFGEESQRHEKPGSKEYHVHGKAFSSIHQSASSDAQAPKQAFSRVKEKPLELDSKKRGSQDMTPEEEIEIAFKVIDSNT